eukprot:SM000033S12380  [mRNA]  locus=s33:491742:500742:- [translate_table: standard]
MASPTRSAKGSASARLAALRRLRQELSADAVVLELEAPLLHEAVALLVSCLVFGTPEDQLVEAAWCLTNIASGEHDQTEAIVPAVGLLVAHLGESSPPAVAEQCAWAVGNVAGDSAELRALVLAAGGLPALCRLALLPLPRSPQQASPPSQRLSLLRTAVWALSNLIKGSNPRPSVDMLHIKGLPEALVSLLTHGDTELAAEAAWVLVYCTSLSNSNSSIFVSAGAVAPLLEFLSSSTNLHYQVNHLGALSSMLSGAVRAIAKCLRIDHRTLRKAAMTALLHLLSASTFDLKKEAAYAIANLCADHSSRTEDRMEVNVDRLTAVVHGGCLPGFVSLLRSPDVEAATVGVLSSMPGKQGPSLVEAEDGMDALESLQYHGNEELRIMANTLIDRYFGEEYGLEEEYGPASVDMLQQDVDYPAWRQGGGKSQS